MRFIYRSFTVGPGINVNLSRCSGGAQYPKITAFSFRTTSRPITVKSFLSNMSTPSLYPEVPEDLFKRLHGDFEAALAKKKLRFTPSTLVPDTDQNVDFVYTYAPSLSEKPELKDNKVAENTTKSEPVKTVDPFQSPDPDLTVLSDFATDYRVLLNKFAVTPDHFLLVTKEQVPQNSALTEADLEAAFSLLHAANSQTGKRHIGFYNCGLKSGASVDHKHIQFFSLPVEVKSTETEIIPDWKPVSFADNKFRPFPDILVEGKRNSFSESDDPLRCPSLPFNHYVAPIPDNYLEDPEILHFRLSCVLSRCLTVLSMQEHKDISYNLVFTEEWILAVPRKEETVDGRSINSVGMIGLLLAKKKEDLLYYRNKRPISLLAQLTFPFENVEPSEEEQNVLYTRY